MTRTFEYKGLLFSLVTTEEIANHDMSFGIYLNGELIGTTIYGGITNWENYFNSEAEKDAFMYVADVEAHKEEARLKFAHEFGLIIEQADQLNLSIEEIYVTMQAKWSIPNEIMAAILPKEEKYVTLH